MQLLWDFLAIINFNKESLVLENAQIWKKKGNKVVTSSFMIPRLPDFNMQLNTNFIFKMNHNVFNQSVINIQNVQLSFLNNTIHNIIVQISKMVRYVIQFYDFFIRQNRDGDKKNISIWCLYENFWWCSIAPIYFLFK